MNELEKLLQQIAQEKEDYRDQEPQELYNNFDASFENKSSSYNFKQPTYGKLTRDQRLALEEDEAIALAGGPGTGKTVVSLWRHIRNFDLYNKSSLLLTYTKTLEHYLRQAAATINIDASQNISRTQKWICSHHKNHYDEIIIDEAQDIEIEMYHKINEYASGVSYGADEAQGLYNGCTIRELESLFPNNEPYELKKNFRNSKEILEFSQALFPDLIIPDDVIDGAIETGNLPILQMLGWDHFEESVIENIVEIAQEYNESTHNIGILLPSQNKVNMYYEKLKGQIDCSKFFSDMGDFEELKRIHITTYKSAKGLEFDSVVAPEFDAYIYYIRNYPDNYSEKDYFVALTRAKRNLFLLCKSNINIAGKETYILE